MHFSHLALLGLTVSLCAFAQEACEYPGRNRADDLPARAGYVDFMPPRQLAPFKAALPEVASREIASALTSSDTMWYDESSMVFMYQDSIETVVGNRANCVGRKVGERNKNNPQIAKLMNLFGEDFRFMFPFRKAAGTDHVENSRVLNFWLPPKSRGAVMPVRYWKQKASRAHYYWTFPIGTIIGEVLYEKSPDGKWVVYEVRSRKRYRDGWEVDLFRPFLTAESLASAIIAKRPHWTTSPSLRNLVDHLRDASTLVKTRWESQPFGKAFTPMDGAIDPLPGIEDTSLITDLLTQTRFVSAEGAIWKQKDGLETYGPGSDADYGIVPKGYEMGMVAVNEVSCNRCHSETSHNLGDFEFDAILYGEVWGEDRIFTWHPFEANRYVYDTWDEADSQTRAINKRMVTAGLIKDGKPTSGDSTYKPLKSAYVPEMKLQRTGRHQ